MTDTPTTCLFCAIADGRLPTHLVHQDEEIMAFMDIQPIRPGHTLIIPRAHHAYFEDLPPATAARIVDLGQRLAREMKRIWQVPRGAFAFTGIDVAHTHAHVFPMVEVTDVLSKRQIAEPDITVRPMPRAEPAELAGIAARLADAVRQG